MPHRSYLLLWCLILCRLSVGVATGQHQLNYPMPRFDASGSETRQQPELVLDYVIPPNYASQSGGDFFFGHLANSPYTYQFLIHDSLLVGIRGQRLTAVRWRIIPSATSPWPASDVTYPNYDIYLSGSVAPANRSLTFAQNVVGPQTLVRSGSLLIPAGSYPGGGNPNAFGPEITFNTPWQYTEGHLLIELRHNRVGGANAISVDAISNLNSGAGYGTAFSACLNSSYTSTSGVSGNFVILSLTGVVTGIDDLARGIPDAYALEQNYPNPFNPTTNITYRVASTEFVELAVFDLLGRRVATLVNEVKEPGSYDVTFDASALASGVYLYRLQAGAFTETKKLVLIR